MTRCRHCRKLPASRARGLCWRCSFDPAVRDLYPASPHRRDLNERRETEAELEALIAEQMKPENLPSWWPAEVSRLERGVGRDR